MSSNSYFAEKGLKQTIANLNQELKDYYLADKKPWVIGYSGGKDSTVILQLVWNMIMSLKPADRKKNVYVITTDTLVENPEVAKWVEMSHAAMKKSAQENQLPIKPKILLPAMNKRFWVNLLGRGYPAPRRGFRWCTQRLKISPTNDFINKLTEKQEVMLLLGTRRAESLARGNSMKKREDKLKTKLKPHSDIPSTSVYSPIEFWTNDDVWIYLNQFENPWGFSNKMLMNLYQGATQDNECPVVVDTTTPSCGSSRFGCWVCTLVDKDKSLTAMINNDEDKEWMMPLLKFRDHLDFRTKPEERDWNMRDFKRMSGKVSFFKTDDESVKAVPGPYTQETRAYLLKELLTVEKNINKNNDKTKFEIIGRDELREIQRIWVKDKYEVEDLVPSIMQEVYGESEVKPLPASKLLQKKYLGLLKDSSESDELYGLARSLLAVELNKKSSGTRQNHLKEVKKTFEKFIFDNREEAEEHGKNLKDKKDLLQVKIIDDYEGFET